MAFLSMKNVGLQHPYEDTHILEGIDLEVGANEFVVLLGSNGSGKSSLLKTINGAYPITSGGIFVESKAFHTKSMQSIAKNIALLSQDLNQSVFGALTVKENLQMACRAKETDYFLEMLGRLNKELLNYLHHPVGKLSLGQKQALALAMCFARKPKILLLDEHTSALDPAKAETFMELTDAFAKEFSCCILMTTHLLEYALNYGNRLLVLHQGRVIHNFQDEEKAQLTRGDLLSYYM